MSKLKRIHIYVLALTACLISPQLMQAQIDNNYVPFHAADGLLPKSLYDFNLEGIVQQIKGGDQLEAEKLKRLATDIYYFKKEYAEGGNFYLKNELTDYVQSIGDEIHVSIPANKNNFKFYLSRSMEVNAFCMADGTVIINLGLIASLDNESQLAFIMAHEISHYLKQHSVNDLKRTADAVTYDNVNQNSNRAVFRRLQFSRDSEFDADGFAINLLATTNFDAMECITALEKLKVSDTLVDSDPQQVLLNKYFKSEYCDFDTSWTSEKAIAAIHDRAAVTSESNLMTQDFGDLLSTHPEIEKRQYALKEIMSNFDYSDIEKVEKFERKDFQYIQRIARFEMVENSMRESYYTHALYNAVRLLEYYPDNIYLNTTLSKSLYWISYYKEINSGKLVVRQPVTTNDKAFFRIKAIIEKLDVTAAKKLSYGNAKILSEALSSNEVSLFYMALNTEHYLGKNASFTYYNKYLKTYPEGRFVEFVNNRLSYMQ